MQRRNFLQFSAIATMGVFMQNFLSANDGLPLIPEESLKSNVKQKFVTLNNGKVMPMLGLGMWDLRGDDCKRVVSQALEVGYRSFDTAQLYGNEKELGDVIKEVSNSSVKREEIFVTSKINSARNFDDAMKKIDESVKKIGSYIDLMLIHWPTNNNLEIYKALEKANDDGMIKSCGISNFFGKDLDEIINNARIMPVLNQCETHLYHQNKELQKKLKEKNIYLEAYSPFGGSKHVKDILFGNDILTSLAQNNMATQAQIIIAWLIQRDIIVIPKTRTTERLKENFEAFRIHLEDEEMKILDSLDKNKSLRGW